MSKAVTFFSCIILLFTLSITVYELVITTAGIEMEIGDAILHKTNVKIYSNKIPDEDLGNDLDHSRHHNPKPKDNDTKKKNNDNPEPKKTDPKEDPNKPDTEKPDPNKKPDSENPKPENKTDKPEPVDHKKVPSRSFNIICPPSLPCHGVNYIFDFYGYKENLADIKGPSAYEQAGGIVPDKVTQYEFLCKISVSKFCNSLFLSEMVDRVFVMAPRYYIHQNIEPMLTMYHYLFLDYIKSIGMKTCVIEAIVESRNQHYESTAPNNEPYEIRTKIEDTFYIRENLLNVAAKKTLAHWDYMMWIDAHHFFDNTYWWEEAIWKMEHYAGVQFFQHLARLDEWNNTLPNLDLRGTMWIYSMGKLEGTAVWAGNAWGIRKDLYQQIGYILDTCIAGGCDYSYTMASLKDPNEWDGLDQFPHYKAQQWPWIVETNKIFKGKGTYIRGFVRHFCHEHFFDYFGFLQKLGRCCFDIKEDLRRDEEWGLHLNNDRMKEMFSKM